MITRRDRIYAALNGEVLDRIPTGFWMHFPDNAFFGEAAVNAHLEYFEKTKYVVIVSVSCGIINIILNYFCIGIFGYIACAYTTLLSYALFALGHHYFMIKTLKSCEINAEVADSRLIFFTSLGILLASICITLLYEMPIIRYTILTLMCLVLYINRKRIIMLFKKMKNRG